jgi:hypothetical protein
MEAEGPACTLGEDRTFAIRVSLYLGHIFRQALFDVRMSSYHDDYGVVRKHLTAVRTIGL